MSKQDLQICPHALTKDVIGDCGWYVSAERVRIQHVRVFIICQLVRKKRTFRGHNVLVKQIQFPTEYVSV